MGCVEKGGGGEMLYLIFEVVSTPFLASLVFKQESSLSHGFCSGLWGVSLVALVSLIIRF